VPESFFVLGVLATPPVAAEVGLVLEAAMQRAVTVDGWRGSPDAWAFLDELLRVGRTYYEARAAERKAQATKDGVAPAVAPVAPQMSRPATVAYMTTAEVARAENVSVAAVAARCRRGTVPGARQTPCGWRIPLGSVRRCP
jgi:hypothetical protein